MTKTDYLKELDRYLKRLPRADYEEAMAYFTEYFEEAGEENTQQVIADLGTPKEAANELIHNLLDNQSPLPTGSKTRKKRDTLLLIVLGILSTPVTIPAALAAIGFFISILLGVVSLLVTGFALSLTGLMVAGATIWESFSLLKTGSSFLMTLGGGIAIFGLGVLGLMVVGYLSKIFGQGLLSLAKWLIRKGRRHV